jgi:Flp pilus assembly protein TadB
MPRRRRPAKRRQGIGPSFVGGAAGVLAFAVVFAATASVTIALIGAVAFGLAAVAYLPVRRWRRARAARR